jgi:hypothetical protein
MLSSFWVDDPGAPPSNSYAVGAHAENRRDGRALRTRDRNGDAEKRQQLDGRRSVRQRFSDRAGHQMRFAAYE